MTVGQIPWSIGALALVIALATALLLLAHRILRAGWFGRAPADTAAARQLVLLEVLSLDPKRRIQLVRCADRRIVILTGGPTDVLLASLGDRSS